MSKKLTIKFIREEFFKEWYILLTKAYINCKQKLDYICPNWHEDWYKAILHRRYRYIYGG